MSDPQEHIDSYLLGRLSEDEHSAFEAQLRVDSKLSAELQFRKQIREGLQQADAEEVRARIGGIAARNPKATFPRFWLYVASIVLLAGIGGWFLLSGGNSDGPALFTEYYHPQIQLDLSRDPASAATLTDTLSERYLAADYAFLERRLASLPDSSQSRNLQILEAVSLIELKRDTEADILLASLMSGTENEYTDQAAWLKALLHLRNEEYDPAIVLLKSIAGDSGKLHHGDAQEILQQIED